MYGNTVDSGCCPGLGGRGVGHYGLMRTESQVCRMKTALERDVAVTANGVNALKTPEYTLKSV